MSSLIRRLKRRVLCGVLDLHVGKPESAVVRTVTFDARLVYVRCSRCGSVEPIDLEPTERIPLYDDLGGPIHVDDL